VGPLPEGLRTDRLVGVRSIRPTSTFPPPPTAAPPTTKPGKPKRPAFGLLILATVGFRFGREILERVAFSRYGIVGVVVVALLGIAVVVGWRVDQRRRAKRQGGSEFTTETIIEQFRASGLAGPAFPEDGTLLGSSVLVVNQRSKLVEINTEYEAFGLDGNRLGAIQQHSQSKARRAVRLLTAFDQYMTHHFEVTDRDGASILRITRPRKLFLTKVHVFDGSNRFLGSIVQQNVFWKIRFELRTPEGWVIGHMHAENVRAWDFAITDGTGREVAKVVKSWEGWARTAFTRADRYVARIHEPLPTPLRELVVATALTVDLALKQDARSFG
jgi:uncharacterized protein YxjI